MMMSMPRLARRTSLISGLALGLVLVAGSPGGASADVVRLGAPSAAIASAVSVPAGYRTVYVSGQVPSPLKPGTPAGFGDTKTQTLSVLGKIRDILLSQGMGMGDVVMMRVYLVGDPARRARWISRA